MNCMQKFYLESDTSTNGTPVDPVSEKHQKTELTAGQGLKGGSVRPGTQHRPGSFKGLNTPLPTSMQASSGPVPLKTSGKEKALEFKQLNAADPGKLKAPHRLLSTTGVKTETEAKGPERWHSG